MRLWSSTGSLLQSFEGFKQERFILKPAFAGPNDDLVLIGSEDGYVFVWSKVQGSKLGVFKGHGSTVNTVVIHPKSPNLVVTTSDDGTVKMWNLMPRLGSIV
jgi:WD40 repeat protein